MIYPTQMGDDILEMLWVEKYRPKAVSEMVIAESTAMFFASLAKISALENLLSLNAESASSSFAEASGVLISSKFILSIRSRAFSMARVAV